MRLVRTRKLPKNLKQLCPLPSDVGNVGGLFFALHGCNDLPDTEVNADLPNLLQVGKVWMGLAGTNPSWTQLTSMNDVPKFRASFTEDFDACSVTVCVTPFMPQFFFVPRNSRGRRVFNRCK